MSAVALAAACTLQVASSEVEPADGGWLEETRLEVIADGAPCPWVDLLLPPGVHLRDVKGKERLGDGTVRRLGSERFEPLPHSLSGDGRVRVHLPDLLAGDRVQLEVTREWAGEAALRWEPAPARYAELRLPKDVDHELVGDVRLDGRSAWVSDAAADDAVVLSTEGRSGAFEPPWPELQPAGAVEERRAVELLVPPGDPQLHLFPGGGSATRTEVGLRFPAEERVRGHLVPLPPERSELAWTVEPDGAAEVVEREDGLLIVLEPSEGPTRVGIGWVAPDAPTFGERPNGLADYEVSAPGGLVVWEGDSWLLAAVHDRPVLPAREALLRALDRRFRATAIPEPGLPNALRGRELGWDLAGELRDALYGRAAPATWTAEPLWPRKLVKARGSGAVTPTEAALIVWLYAKQVGLTADWALVRPAPQGAGGRTSPAGYDAALVRLELAGETRWVDPSCTVCAPFELRPELEGASAIGPDIERTPDPSPGRWQVELGAEGIRWTLEGPAALELRRWLDALPAEGRETALAERVAGPGATVVQSSGIDAPGAPIVVVASRGHGVAADPLELPVPRDDGTVWVPWIGERRVVHTDPEQGASVRPVEGQAGPLVWRRAVEDGALVEVLEVTERLVSAEALAAWEAARAPAAAPADEPGSDDADDEGADGPETAADDAQAAGSGEASSD